MTHDTQGLAHAGDRNLLVICGATASGKTRLGVQVSLRLAGEIISADSRQIYRGMDIGTGKDLSEYHTPEGSVACHLIDVAEPAQIYTLYHYQRDFYKVLSDIRNRGRLPILTGGTGLYIEAVLKGYALPAVPEDAELRRDLMHRGKEELDERLRQLDRRLHERTDRSSKKRIVRAIEVAMHRSKNRPEEPDITRSDIRPLVLAVRRPRQVLHERIRRRLHQRMEEGMVEEVQKLLEQGIDRGRMALFGMEYKHITRYLCGDIGREKMLEVLERDIRRLAKRQMTWFRGMERRGIEVEWIDGADVEQALRVISRYRLASAPLSQRVPR
jgi:tRNA dimethylallyltransferase